MKKALLIYSLFFLLFSLSLDLRGQSGINLQQNHELEQIFKDWGEVYFSFQPEDLSVLKSLTKIISLDNVKEGVVYAFANKKEFNKFLGWGIPYTILPPPAIEFLDDCVNNIDFSQPLAWDFYPSYTAYETMMYQFETDYPDLCRIENIGTLSSGRKLLAAKISSQVDSAMNKPQFIYVSSIHGNELTGYVNMLRLIDYLLSNYNTDPYVSYLVNNIEIYINPLGNPDGTYHNGNNSVNGATRENANGVDINRNFPDPQDGLHPDGNPWQEETVAFMEYASNKHFVMGANFHGGAEVVNYPWDTWVTLAADDNWWYHVSRQFADTIHVYNNTGYFTYMDNGVTNGYAWYEIDGGRQDYMNYWENCREVTLEVSNVKKPSAATLPTYWNSLYRSLLYYMEQSLYGIRGIVTDSVTGEPLHARVYIAGHDIDSSEVYSHLPVGNYHRLLFPGTYNLTYTCPGYFPKTIHNLPVTFNQATLNDVQLVPIWTGVTEKGDVSIEVFPNPVESVFSFRFSGKTGIYHFELVNSVGEQCLSERLPLKDGVKVPVNISNLPSGIYLLRLSDQNRSVITRKIIKE
ncbi:MAG: M14 family zinc carboxypeptidase [Bacteroidales bacterium]